MKIILTLATAITAVFFTAQAESIQDRKIETRNPGNFYGIMVNTNANIIITQSEYTSVQIAGEKSVIENVMTEVINGALVISGPASKSVDIYITVENLNLIEVNGTARILGKGTFNTDVVLLKVNGSGSIKMDIRSLTVGMIVKGSGKIIASGSTGSSFVKVFGTGNVFTSDLDSFSNKYYSNLNQASGEKRPTLKLQ